MPFALVFIGLVLVVTGARGTMRELGAELRADFVGPGNFTWWIVSIGLVGALGYVPELRGFSRWFMSLIIISMIIANRGFFGKLIEALNTGPISPQGARQEAARSTNEPGSGNTFSNMLDGMDKLGDVLK